MWEHGGCLESVQQDAISKCDHLDDHDIGTCELRAEGTGTISTNTTRGCLESVQQNIILRCGQLDCYAWRMCHGWGKVENMINTLPWKPHVALWMALLSACRIHELQRLSGLQHDAVYVPYTNCFLHDAEAEEKLFQLCHHSKKLAIAFGLINTAPGTPLPIRENLYHVHII